VNRNHKKFILTPVHNTPHLQRISAATRAGLVMVEMKEKAFRNIRDSAKKAGVTRRVLSNRSSISGSSERKKTKLD
jgi:hypothetical protein